MSTNAIAERSFTLDDLQWFAAASGDWNPIHVDPVHARRLLAGQVVVHGMFTLIWALDGYCACGGRPVTSIAVNFLRPVLVDNRLILVTDDGEPGSVRLAIRCEGVEVVTIVLAVGGARIDAQPHPDRPVRTVPDVNSFAALKGKAGHLRVTASPDDLHQGFPHAAHVLGTMTLASLLALSRLVGMTCPGLHSLFASVNLQLDPARSNSDMAWTVVRHSVPQAPLRLSLEGAGLSGWLDAFVRPQPVEQAGIEAVAARVEPAAFSGQVALVVGGSRGLGELTAKIVAAGGGRAIISYLLGTSDAERVVDEITRWGGRVCAVSMDVEHPQSAVAQLQQQGLVPTHLYYFAAPRIGGHKSGRFDEALWRLFSSVFVEGFARVVRCVKESFDVDLRVFYPSSVFLDEQPAEFVEYIAAKAAGEALCSHMMRHTVGLQMLVRRLPRVPTDQTAGLIRLSTADPLPLMLGVVADMHSSPSRE